MSLQEEQNWIGIPKRLLKIQICHIVLAFLAIGTILVMLFLSLRAKNNDVVIEMFLSALGVEFILTLYSLTLVVLVRELKYGPNADDKILLALLCFLTIFLTVFMPPVMLLGLPLVITGLAIYNIAIVKRKIQDIKLTSGEGQP